MYYNLQATTPNIVLSSNCFTLTVTYFVAVHNVFSNANLLCMLTLIHFREPFEYQYDDDSCSDRMRLFSISPVLVCPGPPCPGPPCPGPPCPGPPWFVLVCPNPLWSALIRPGLRWSSLVCPDPSWSALVLPGLPWSALIRPGLP